LWNGILADLEESGMKMVVNCDADFLRRQKLKLSPNIIHVEFPLDEILALALVSYGAISIRSGICDFLFFSNNKMTVFYAEEDSYTKFGLENIFGTREKGLLEIIADKDPDAVRKMIKKFFCEKK
jgi:hypothetical protein